MKLGQPATAAAEQWVHQPGKRESYRAVRVSHIQKVIPVILIIMMLVIANNYIVLNICQTQF